MADKNTKQSRFVQMLTASDKTIKANRAQHLADSTVLEVEAKMTEIRRRKNTLVNKITDLTDLAPENTYSLRPGSKDFNASKWTEELFKTKLDLKLVDIELETIEEIHSEFFATTEE
jgi:hypothetical protein